VAEGRGGEKRGGERLTYAAAGVDISRTTDALERVKPLIRATFTPQVATDVGTFGAMYSLAGIAEQDSLLVMSTDSVGTKVMVASMMGRHNTVGRDLVAHCANDILVQGARPLFFLDYIAADQLPGDFVAQVIEGLAEGCKEAGCALIGGEMAELPATYLQGQCDLVGFIVGAVRRGRAITGESIRPGDVLLGLVSNGLHTNGYSLARKAFFEVAGWEVARPVPEFGQTLGEELLRVHRCYCPSVLPLLEEAGPADRPRVEVKGMAHITGGGLPDNVVRCLPEGCQAVIEKDAWPVPAVFRLIQEKGGVEEGEMFHVFNMGIGLVLVVAEEQAEEAASRLAKRGETVYRIGKVAAGERQVVIQ
jgi:phosphoribosylformylglycinamidine cyclo-ligase